jgi:hypothetical protein
MNLNPEAFEAGENVTEEVRKGKTAGMVVSVRLSPEDSSNLISLAEESGKTVSQVVRQAIRSFLGQNGQHQPSFVPEITGDMPNVKVTAFAPLGPRTSKDGTALISSIKNPSEPREVRTGAPV